MTKIVLNFLEQNMLIMIILSLASIALFSYLKILKKMIKIGVGIFAFYLVIYKLTTLGITSKAFYDFLVGILYFVFLCIENCISELQLLKVLTTSKQLDELVTICVSHMHVFVNTLIVFKFNLKLIVLFIKTKAKLSISLCIRIANSIKEVFVNLKRNTSNYFILNC